MASEAGGRRIVFFTSTARHGNTRPSQNLSRLLTQKRCPANAATAEQIHGNRIAVVPSLPEAHRYAAVDGLLTQALRQPLVIFTADCVPIFVSCPSRRVVGVLHAGWRGVRGHILEKAVRLIQRTWGGRPSEIHVVLGPAIGPCCFETGWDVARYFPHTRQRRAGRWFVDLHGELMKQGKRLGIPPKQMTHINACTYHQKRYFSFRRNQTTDRMASAIWQKGA